MQAGQALFRVLRVLADAYASRERLWPALLTVLPILLLVDGERRGSLGTMFSAVALMILCGGGWLLAQVVQALGHRCEDRLRRCWGGRPGVCMMRHRDHTVDSARKRACHARLEARSKIRLPTLIEEALDPVAADTKYDEAIAWIERHMGDRIAFPTLWHARGQYEFLLNSLALRWLGVILSLASLGRACIGDGSVSVGLQGQWEVAAFISLHSRSASVGLISGLMALAWLFFFTPGRVRSAAWSYDLTLLEST